MGICFFIIWMIEKQISLQEYSIHNLFWRHVWMINWTCCHLVDHQCPILFEEPSWVADSLGCLGVFEGSWIIQFGDDGKEHLTLSILPTSQKTSRIHRTDICAIVMRRDVRFRSYRQIISNRQLIWSLTKYWFNDYFNKEKI